MFEGVPTHSDSSRFWRVVEKHRVNMFYTAPTAIRGLMRGRGRVDCCDKSSLACWAASVSQLIPKLGWYHNVVGEEWCSVDTRFQRNWWNTITPLPLTATKQGQRQTIFCRNQFLSMVKITPTEPPMEIYALTILGSKCAVMAIINASRNLFCHFRALFPETALAATKTAIIGSPGALMMC